MMGLVIISILLLYIAISALVVWISIRIARKRNIKGWKFGVPAGLCMYLLVAWDQIPTYALHQYYCYTEAGYWEYKTPEQWMKENPGAMEEVHWIKGLSSEVILADGTGRYLMSDRIVWDSRVKRNQYLPVSVYTHEVVDIETSSVFSKEVSVASGFGNRAWKFWVGAQSCGPKLGVGKRPFKKFREGLR